MIKSFGGKETKKVFNREFARKLPHDIQRVALRKLLMIDAARDLRDLMVPPANQLEQLVGNRLGQYSIRVNKQWRICFNWKEGNAYTIEITDYH
ncbi:plasmid maintenance system killer [bacterium CG10_46_32]|nr:MAG: plasmid maintenance system killer [bacterium CG10_46_32]PIR56014.1 MAG: plasmid maintenance system killer [Parcubacteria group bacterium CG10_big_fil_rev_8_21_14_0_10_46_32]